MTTIGQTSVAAKMSVGYPGLISDASYNHDIASKVNADVVSIPFGLMVVHDTTPTDDGVLVPTANTNLLVGIVVHSHAYEKPYELDAVGLLPGITMAILRHGRVIVSVDEAVAITDAVKVRVDTNGGKVAGSIGKTANAGHTVDISKCARWITSTAGAGLAELEIDMTGIKLATND